MKKNKLTKFVQARKVPLMVISGVLLAGLAGGSYYLAAKQDGKFGKPTKTTETPAETVPSTQTQQNVEQKSEAVTGATIGATTVPTTTTTAPTTAPLTDASLSAIRDSDGTKAYVSLNGPAGTYGIERLVDGNWQVVVSSFDYAGHGGSDWLDTILSTTAVTHYRVFKLTNGARSSVSGDTTVSWQQLLDKGGILTVPLAG